MDDLVKRLRDVAAATGPNEAKQIALEAADRIEANAKRIVRDTDLILLQAEKQFASEARIAELEAALQATCQREAAGIVRAEAKLDAAVGAARVEALREADAAVCKAREIVIYSDNCRYVDGVYDGHERATAAIRALIEKETEQ